MKQTHTIYFLGGGNMAEAIIYALQKSNIDLLIVVVEKLASRREYLQKTFPSITVLKRLTNSLTVEDILFIAVKPQDAYSALREIIFNSTLAISIVAGLSIQTLTRYLNGTKRIIRMMPNTPVSVLKGMYGLYACQQDILSTDQELVEYLLKDSGQLIWVAKEDDLHSITAISGSGPAYVFYFMNALFEAAKKLDLNETQAKLLVEQIVLGGVSLAQVSPFSFQALQAMVTSTKGTTYEAIKVFDDRQLNSIIIEAIEAGVKRSKEISNELESCV